MEQNNNLHFFKKVGKVYQEVIKADEPFNIFSLLDVSTEEVRLHSKLIGELLDIKGSHRCKALFFNEFIELLSSKEGYGKLEFNTSQLCIKVEHSIGQINRENKTGGRIDILIEDDKTSICIENKIYATDQPDQLERYCNYKKSNNIVVYLTLFNTPYGNESKLKPGKNYICISYKDDIKYWLEKCLTKIDDSKPIKEILNQYLSTIKDITGQNSSKLMIENMIVPIKENLALARAISNTYNEVIEDLMLQFKNDLILLLKAKFPKSEYEVFPNKGAATGAMSAIFIEKKESQIRIGIESLSGKGHNDGQLFIGIIIFDKNELVNFKSDNQSDQFNNSKYGWVDREEIRENGGTKIINFSKDEFLNKLANPDETKILLDQIVKVTENYIVTHKPALKW